MKNKGLRHSNEERKFNVSLHFDISFHPQDYSKQSLFLGQEDKVIIRNE